MAMAPIYVSGSCKSERLVVKSTFLDFDDGHQHRQLFRSLSDSSLCRPSSLPEYFLGDYCSTLPSLVSCSSSKLSDERSESSGAGKSFPSSSDIKDDLSEISGTEKSSASAPVEDRARHRSGEQPRAPGGERPRTTLMLRNLPNDYTRTMLLKMLDGQGLAGTYDFVYLPMDFNRRCSLGYAFVNLVDTALMPRFAEALHGFSQWAVRSRKVCEVVWSEREQGVKANVKRYRNSSVMHPDVPDEFKPCLFSGGRRVPFPAPRTQVARPVTHPGRRP